MLSKKRVVSFLLIFVILVLGGCTTTDVSEPTDEGEVLTVETEASEEAEESESSEEAEEAEEETATEEMCVRIANYESSGEQASMDPAIMYSGGDAPYIYAVYERLVDVTPDFEVIPELAESWEKNEDATEWTFYLQKGVKFHDGSDFDAGDVVYTFQRLLDPELGSSATVQLESFLKSENIEAVDEHTVVFRTEEPTPELPLLLTLKNTGIVSEGATNEELRLNGNGTGPFMQDFFEPGTDYVKLLASPNYWQEGLPKTDCLEIRVITEATTANAALQGGDIDVVLQIDSSALSVLENDPNVTLLETAAGNSMTLSMWTDTAPYDDVNVRQAMKMVVGRDVMVNTILSGFGEAGADNPVPVTDPRSYLDAAPEQNIVEAISLLETVGYGPDNPLEVELFCGDAVPGLLKMAEVYQQQAAEANIIVDIVPSPAESYWDDVWLKQPFVCSAWSRRPVPSALAMAYPCDAAYPETHWCRERFDNLLATAATTADNEVREELYNEAQQYLAEDGGVIIPMFVHAVAGMRAECSGWAPHVQNFNNDWSQVSCD